MNPFYDTLMKILSWDFESPTIMAEEPDGCISLDWHGRGRTMASISIWPNGRVSWATRAGNESSHGVELEEFRQQLEKCL